MKGQAVGLRCLAAVWLALGLAACSAGAASGPAGSELGDDLGGQADADGPGAGLGDVAVDVADAADGGTGPALSDGSPSGGEDGTAEDAASGDDATEGPSGLPRELPFVLTRPDVGEPLTAEEVTAFTRRVTGVWKQVGWFRWLLRTSMGVDASVDADDYLAWHNDVLAVKAGDTVTFMEKGQEHNMWIASATLLSQAVGGYLLTGEWTHAKASEQLCKGLSAVVKGFRRGDDDPAPFLMARAVFPMDQTFTLDAARWQDDGRKKAVEFHEAYHEDFGWNAQAFAWPDNPLWGDIWVTNMRSKDDVRAIVRTTVFLHYAAEDAPDPWVREACAETLDIMRGFNKDIVDHGYYIRTKGPDGVAYSFDHEDLGNYVQYVDVDPGNECPARLAADLSAYGEPLTNDCGSGFGSLFDQIAPASNYYNYAIIWDYHMAALGEALVHREDAIAEALLGGLVERLDTYLDPDTEEIGASDPGWERDMALLLVQAAALGFPLTADEARRVRAAWTLSADAFEEWPNWDLWDESVPDGEYWAGGGFRPSAPPGGIGVEYFALFLETCSSPFRNPSSAAFVDCEVVRDPSQW